MIKTCEMLRLRPMASFDFAETPLRSVSASLRMTPWDLLSMTQLVDAVRAAQKPSTAPQ